MRNSAQQSKNDISRFIESQLHDADVKSIKDLIFYLDKLPDIYSPFYPEKWALRPSNMIPEEKAAKMESGKRLLEVLIKEAPSLDIPVVILPAFDYNDETHHYRSYTVGFNVYGKGGYIEIVPIAFGPLSSDFINQT